MIAQVNVVLNRTVVVDVSTKFRCIYPYYLPSVSSTNYDFLDSL